jgi:hypothetical protein
MFANKTSIHELALQRSHRLTITAATHSPASVIGRSEQQDEQETFHRRNAAGSSLSRARTLPRIGYRQVEVRR